MTETTCQIVSMLLPSRMKELTRVRLHELDALASHRHGDLVPLEDQAERVLIAVILDHMRHVEESAHRLMFHWLLTRTTADAQTARVMIAATLAKPLKFWFADKLGDALALSRAERTILDIATFRAASQMLPPAVRTPAPARRRTKNAHPTEGPHAA
jgi:hypothetical protein